MNVDWPSVICDMKMGDDVLVKLPMLDAANGNVRVKLECKVNYGGIRMRMYPYLLPTIVMDRLYTLRITQPLEHLFETIL